MKCRVCGQNKDGIDFNQWVKQTFTNYDLLVGDGDVICDDCAFWFDQASEELQKRVGKDKPQRMQNYSHFILGGEWIPVGKGDKDKMKRLLLDGAFPELAAIAVSGQKHLVFRARRNPAGQNCGWVQFEEQAVWVDQDKLRNLLDVIERLYKVFSKAEIESGKYLLNRVYQYGIEKWIIDDKALLKYRKTGLFELALFLAKRSENGDERDDSDNTANDMAGDTARLQEQIPNDDLGAIRERDQIGGLHKQPPEIYQYSLFEITKPAGKNRRGAGTV